MRFPPRRLAPTLELSDPQVRLSLVTAAALLLEAVVAAAVLRVDLDFAGQFAPLFLFVVFQAVPPRSRAAEVACGAAIALVAVAVLALHAR